MGGTWAHCRTVIDVCGGVCAVWACRDKKAELVKLASAIFERKEELTKRPVQVAMLSYMLNHSRSSLVGITEVPDPHTTHTTHTTHHTTHTANLRRLSFFLTTSA